MGAFDIELLLRGLYPTDDSSPPARPARSRDIPRHPAVWRVGERPAAPVRTVPCGIPGLDQQLPGGGWQPGCITEIVGSSTGIGEVSLLLPALAHLSRQGETVAWVAPPFIPYPPALQQAGIDMAHTVRVDAHNETDAVWAAEQSLRSGVCGAVLVWLGSADHTAFRRLQLAAEAGGACCFVLRDQASAGHSSPAAVRVAVDSDGRRRQVRLLKRRGGHSGHVSLAA